MKQLHAYTIILYILIISACVSTNKNTSTNNLRLNQYTFSEVDSLLKIEPRPIAVFLHTSWCAFCKNMEHTTFTDPSVLAFLNDKYYFVSFDGEQKEPVNFRNHIFKFKPNGRNSGTHELAFTLGQIDGNLSYPTFVLLNQKYEIEFQHSAFISKKEMKNILSLSP